MSSGPSIADAHADVPPSLVHVARRVPSVVTMPQADAEPTLRPTRLHVVVSNVNGNGQPPGPWSIRIPAGDTGGRRARTVTIFVAQ